MRESAINEKWIGQRFGRLTVCGFEHSDQRHKWLWVCRCDCGKQVGSSSVSGKERTYSFLRLLAERETQPSVENAWAN